MNMPIAEVKARQSAKDQTRFAALWRPALVQAFVKLDPRQLKRSPVMLVGALTAVLTTDFPLSMTCSMPDFAAVVPLDTALPPAVCAAVPEWAAA